MTPKPEAPAPAPELVKIRRYSRLFVWSMIAAWLLSFAPMIYRLGTLPLSLLAIVLGVLAFWATFGVPNMGSLRVMLGMGGIGAAAFALMGIGWLAIAPEVVKLDSCTRTALTPQAELVCQQDFRVAVKARYGVDFP
jgi:hypothetical protein